MNKWASVLVLVAGAALSAACGSSDSDSGSGTSSAGGSTGSSGAGGSAGSGAAGASGEGGAAGSGAGGEAGSAAGGGSGAAGAAGAGVTFPSFTDACKADMDAAISTGADIHKQAQSCGTMCVFSGGEPCETDCMKKLGLTDNCASCWGAVINCGIKLCSSVCLNPDKPECMACTEEKCNAQFHTCAGI